MQIEAKQRLQAGDSLRSRLTQLKLSTAKAKQEALELMHLATDPSIKELVRREFQRLSDALDGIDRISEQI